MIKTLDGRPKPHRRNTLRRLSPEVRAELDDRILKRNFTGYRDLKIWLRQHGCMIATTTVKRYANKLEERLGAVRLATEQARAVVEAADDDDLEINEALLRLVQQHLFTVLVELNGVDSNPRSPVQNEIWRLIASDRSQFFPDDCDSE